MPSSGDRYAAPWYLAAYLEAEWTEFLWPDRNSKTTGRADFYKRIPELVLESIGNEQPERYCDIGGSTGRTTHEMFHKFPSLCELVLVEPSAQFCSWARRLLFGGEGDTYEWAPTVADLHKPMFKKIQAFPPPLEGTGQRKVYVYEAQADRIPRPSEYFDVITCLNVVDRVLNPADFARTVGNLLKPGGTLVFASPMDYEETITPNKELWVRDLTDLFPQAVWETLKNEDVPYEAVPYRRKHIVYSTQVLLLKKKRTGA